PVLSGGIHGLQDEQDRPAVLGVELVLQLAHPDDVFFQCRSGTPFGMQLRSVRRIEILQAKPLAVLDPIQPRELRCLHHLRSAAQAAERPLTGVNATQVYTRSPTTPADDNSREWS